MEPVRIGEVLPEVLENIGRRNPQVNHIVLENDTKQSGIKKNNSN